MIKFHHFISSLCLFGLSSLTFANFNDDVTAYKHYEQRLFKQQSPTIQQMKAASQQTSYTHHDFVANFIQHASEPVEGILHTKQGQGGEVANGAMLFISFSMPKSLILEMSHQAAVYHIPVIIRGLVNNDMRKTFQKVLDLQSYANTKHETFDGIKIDPVWFEQFSIDAVPALVVTQRPQGCKFQQMCPNQPFDVVYGNQSIKDSLMDIANNGTKIPKTVAQGILKQGK